MSQCNNCGAKLGCSCKKRTASNGKSCCANCIGNYEKVLKQSKKNISSDNTTGVILNVTAVQK